MSGAEVMDITSSIYTALILSVIILMYKITLFIAKKAINAAKQKAFSMQSKQKKWELVNLFMDNGILYYQYKTALNELKVY